MSIYNLLSNGQKSWADMKVDDLECNNLSVANTMNVEDLNIVGNITGIALNNGGVDDVSIVAVQDKDFLQWDNIQQRWINVVSSASGMKYIDLTDTPASYAGKAKRAPQVNVAENGIQFSHLVIGDAPDNNVVLGVNGAITGTTSFAVAIDGSSNDAASSINIKGTISDGINSVCIGSNSTSSASGGTTIGTQANCDGFLGLALGNQANVQTASNSAIAIGDKSDSQGTDAISIGRSTVASIGAICIGGLSSASGPNSLAVGKSVTSLANEEKFGTGYLHNNSTNQYTLSKLNGTGNRTVLVDANGILSRGIPGDVMAHGEIAFVNFTTPSLVTIGGVGTPVQLNPAGLALSANAMEFNLSGGGLRYIGVPNRIMHIALTHSMKLNTGTASDVSSWVYKNGAPIATSQIRNSILTTTLWEGTSQHAFINMVTNDILTVWVANHTGTNSLDLGSLQLFAMGM